MFHAPVSPKVDTNLFLCLRVGSSATAHKASHLLM